MENPGLRINLIWEWKSFPGFGFGVYR